MRRFALPGLACALAVVVAGCGPMPSPMPHRFPDEKQKELDASWDRAFAPVDRFDHQGLLDVMVGTQAYQLGVDTFTLRAEKRFAGGKVVMEVVFDRARPDDDRFTVTVYDPAGKVARAERYTRREIEDTYDALFAQVPEPADDPDPAAVARRAAREARWKKIEEVFPKPADGQQPAAK